MLTDGTETPTEITGTQVVGTTGRPAAAVIRGSIHTMVTAAADSHQAPPLAGRGSKRAAQEPGGEPAAGRIPLVRTSRI